MMQNLKSQIRFDIVVANTNRSEVFWTSLSSLKNFDLSKDRIIFMDCSRNSQKELEKCRRFMRDLDLEKIDFHFLKRRNWNLNHGAQLDYIRLVAESKLDKPKFTYFMQEHYLNKDIFVKGDTIPKDEVIDLNVVEQFLTANNNMVFFCSRNGFRISSFIKDEDSYYRHNRVKDMNTLHFKNSSDICFIIDGGNYCLDISHYFDHYGKHKDLYIRGNGCIHFCGVWETRLCKILYDQGLTFYEKRRNLKFKTVNELKSKYPNPGEIWGYFYQRPHAYYFYGQDIFKYSFQPRKEYIEELAYFCYFNLTYNRDASIHGFYPRHKRYL